MTPSPIRFTAVMSLFALIACGAEPIPVTLVEDPGPQMLFDPNAISNGDTFVGDIIINSQVELDQFIDYKRIDGHVTIGSEYLSELIWKNLQKIDGYLFIWDNPALKTIELSSLREVGGTLLIRENNKLTEATKAMALYILDKNIGTQEEVENFLKHIENTDSWIINPNKSAE